MGCLNSPHCDFESWMESLTASKTTDYLKLVLCFSWYLHRYLSVQAFDIVIKKSWKQFVFFSDAGMCNMSCRKYDISDMYVHKVISYARTWLIKITFGRNQIRHSAHTTETVILIDFNFYQRFFQLSKVQRKTSYLLKMQPNTQKYWKLWRFCVT